MVDPVHLVWFKRDLRIQDHKPLAEAARAGRVVPLYIVEPDYWRLPDVSRRHWHFIHDSLVDLNQALQDLDASLLLRVGPVLSVLADLRQTCGPFTLWSHQETGNAWTYERDKQVQAWCKAQGIVWHELPAHGVVRGLTSRDGWSDLRNARMSEAVIEAPAKLSCVRDLASDPLPDKEDPLFGTAVASVQKGGRREGLHVLESFLRERAKKYMLTISKPGISARHCSRLSAHIAYGTLSVREIEQATQRRMQDLAVQGDDEARFLRKNLSAFLSRLAWRCHFVQKLEQQPDLEFHCQHRAFEGMREDAFRQDYFEAWASGHTGYPLIDAAMRSLQANGWITFRMRAMLVSFASYHLWLDWRQTAPFLARLFTDYEPGIHYAQFQMQSGVTGINAVRMYNPVKQSLDHDPEGKFIRRYVPELADVPAQWIHEPWRMPQPPKDYPPPLVDHASAIAFARAQISARRKGDDFQSQARAVNQKLGSRSKQPKRMVARKKDQTQLAFDL
jgi:deoxyribodipyrimidine photo-lyase